MLHRLYAINYEAIKMNQKLTITLLAIGLLCAACGSDSNDVVANTDASASAGNQRLEVSAPKGKPWSGPVAGYVHNSEAEGDRIQLFMRFGQLLGGASLYNMRASEMRRMYKPDAESISTGHATIASIFDEELLSLYAKVDPLVQANAKQHNTPLDIQGVLIALADPQQIIDVSNGDRSKRDQQYAANQNVHILTSRVRDAVISFFPSRHEYLLASSALIRKAGDKVAVAVSAEGVILDSNLLWDAYTAIDQTIKLNPKNVSYCDAQRLPIKAHKKAIDDLLNQMVPNKLGNKIKVTATDVYELAKQAHAAGKLFPLDDGDGCS
jgi:hypothetical protein